MYELKFSENSLRELEKLEKQQHERIIKSLERIRVRPQTYLKKLVGSPYFSFRVGNYRVILDFKESELLIFVITLGHRKNIYDKI